MNIKKSLFKNYSRRHLIKALGLSAASPFIPVFHTEAQTTGIPKRVCFIMTPNGIAKEVVPTGSGSNFQFQSILRPLEPYKSHITYLHGIDMKTYYAVPTPNDHPPTVNQLLTGALAIDPMDGSNPAVSGTWLSSGTSIDQYLGGRLQQNNDTKTKFSSLVVGVDTGFFAWQKVWSSPRNAIFPENNVGNLHSRVFDGVTPGESQVVDQAALNALASKKSMIDFVKDELDLVMNKVAVEDRHKIEAHLTGIREIERRMEFEQTTTGASCSVPSFSTNGATQEDTYRKKGESMMDIIAHAFACDQTRVATLQWSNGASGQTFPSKGVFDGHHDITHDNYTANAGQRRLVGEWYGDRLAYFVERLASIPEGEGTMLDNTLLVWTSEHSDEGQHGRRNIPFTLAGNLGGAFATGQKLDYSGNTKAHNDVYISIAQAMGFSDVNTFGLESVCGGVLPGLMRS